MPPDKNSYQNMTCMNRRTFLAASTATILAGSAFADTPKKPKLRKAVKYGMIDQ